MGKCLNCNRKGLFLKVNKNGLCSDCASLKIRLHEAEEVEWRAKNANQLLADAIAEARTTAHMQLEMRAQQLNMDIETLMPQLTSLQFRRDDLASQCEQAEKRLKTALTRIEKSKSIYQSMKYAMETFMNPYFRQENAVNMFSVDLQDILGETPELKCLSMKTLRSMYNKNQKKIYEVTSAYQAQYTTKTNATIYKLLVMALNAEMTLILTKLGYGKKDEAIEKVKHITASYYTIAAEGNQTIVNTLNKFIGQIESLYIESVNIEYEYYVQRERAKEEQRAIREQMRQEAEERRQLEAEKKKIEAEEKKYSQEMERIQQKINSTSEQSEIEKLKKRIAELTDMMASVGEKKAEIVNLQNGKAGTVYIISNKGSFGDTVFKVGMTRRLEPQDRVTELGDASVPFPFDVHSFIFSEDAVSLENTLHKELNDRRVNKVNLRKEFFNVTIDELEALVSKIDPSAPFEKTMLAEQYHQSLSIGSPVSEYIDLDDDE